MIGPAPRCMFCIHLDRHRVGGYSCRAYPRPRRIPKIILWDGERHDSVRRGQVGEFVFSPRTDIDIPKEYR